MKTLPVILLSLFVSIPATWFAASEFSLKSDKPAPSPTPATGERRILYYQSAMHPWVKSDKPGRCTVCGMKLTPIYEGETGVSTDAAVVTLAPTSVAALNVATTPAMVRPLVKTLQFPAVVDDNASRHRYLSAYTAGRIEKLHITYEGQEVTAGQVLVEFYSPALLAAERDYRLLGGTLREQAGLRLRQLGLTPEQITAVRTKPADTLTSQILAPLGGTVVTRSAYEGQYVQEGERLFEIADFSTMWLVFNAYENDLPWLKVGQTVEISSPSHPGHTFTGPISFIDPNLDETTRSTKIRVDLPNPVVNGRRTFLHRVSGEARVTVEAQSVLTVPRSAVLQTGREAVVFIDVGGGGYERKTVTLGRRGDELVEVLAGLEADDKVVTNGNLLLDGQAELNRAFAGAPTTATTEPKNETGTPPAAPAPVTGATPAPLSTPNHSIHD